jgi:CDP-diglyceride synthetase
MALVSTELPSTKFLFGVTYYLLLIIILIFFIWDYFHQDLKGDRHIQLERTRVIMFELFVILTICSFAVFVHHIHHSTSHQYSKLWWCVAGILYIGSCLYWVYVQYNGANNPLLNLLSVLLYITISGILMQISCKTGCFNPFEIYRKEMV